MSFADDANELERSFRTTTDMLQRLLQGLTSRRAAWVSARPKVLAPSTELEQLTASIAVEEQRRSDLLQKLRSALPTPIGAESSALHVNVTRIAAALPTAAGKSLREAADAATKLAKGVRTEVTLGQRLLRFSQNAQASVAGNASTATKALPGYDRGARTLRGHAAGALIDGKF
jgi:hypothetical protein